MSLENKLHGHDVVGMGLGAGLGYYAIGGLLGAGVGAGAAYILGEIADKYI